MQPQTSQGQYCTFFSIKNTINLILTCQKLKMGHNRGFQSTSPNNAVNGSAVSNVWGIDSFRRENGEHGAELGVGQGAGHWVGQDARHGAGQGAGHRVGQGGNNNVGQVRDNDINRGQNNNSNNTSSPQQRNREMGDVWGNIGNSSASNQDR